MVKKDIFKRSIIIDAVESYDKTIKDVADVIAEHLTVSESCLIRWYSEQFRIQFENNLKKSEIYEELYDEILEENKINE